MSDEQTRADDPHNRRHLPPLGALMTDKLLGVDLFGGAIKPDFRGALAEEFLFPPFSVLNARDGAWQDRKRAWLALGIKSEAGRSTGGNNSWNGRYKGTTSGESESAAKIGDVGTGPTVFDPVVCELSYRWFCPGGGHVLDPFAGGSVRGIVAGELGFKYWGCDLRQEQIEANEAQATSIGTAHHPVWICGDSATRLSDAPAADFVFSCPPYGDLEKYSDDPGDLSNMDWHAFVAAYRRIILKAVFKLRDNRFACFVVGDFRDKRGFYRNFVGETVRAFELAGARYYNEAILVTPCGSASMRATRQFNGGRKLVKTHQNVLVFCKGDWKTATEAIVDMAKEQPR